jgi:hippurate hydrolase
MNPTIAHGDIADLLPGLIAFRRDLHANPEMAFEERRTSRLVSDALRELAMEVHEGIAGTGVVGVLRSGTSTRMVGLRADMDALPILEQGDRPHVSLRAGVHHACGHDGHTAMLLGAARHLARTRDFDGEIAFIFQPAEEGRGGAREMVNQGLFDRFPCESVYALHNWPDLPVGVASTCAGAIMAAADRFDIVVRGKGAHAALPHQTPDAVLAAAELVSQLHTIVSRRVPPTENAVLSVTRISGGQSHNVLPSAVELTGTVRSFDAKVQDTIENAIRDIAAGVARGTGTSIEVEYLRYYPATVNTPREADLALEAARLAGLDAQTAPAGAFTSEDFAFMLQQRPGAYLWLGQARTLGNVPLHHPAYDFNDDALAGGVRWLVAVARLALERTRDEK